MLDGLLVDRVPPWADFAGREYEWRNREASVWPSGGEGYIATRVMIECLALHEKAARVNQKDG